MNTWTKKLRVLAVLSLSALTSPSIYAVDAPKKPLFLVCGGHLVAISTTLRQNLANALGAQSRAAVSYDVRTLWQGKEIGGPIDMKHVGWASREDIYLTPFYRLDRVTGELISFEERKRPKESGQNACADMTNPINRIFLDCDENYMVFRDKSECSEETQNRLNEIIENHNRKFQDSRPERKF